MLCKSHTIACHAGHACSVQIESACHRNFSKNSHRRVLGIKRFLSTNCVFQHVTRTLNLRHKKNLLNEKMPNINRCFFTIPAASGARGGRIFSQAPCSSQAPFHDPIRRGYRGEGRLSKMDAPFAGIAKTWDWDCSSTIPGLRSLPLVVLQSQDCSS